MAGNRLIERWSDVVEALNIDLMRQINRVKVADVGEISKRDPRHMAKINEQKDLPIVFKAAGAFVVPISNTEWAIVRGKGFHTVERPAEVVNFHSRLPFIPAALRAGISESQRIDYALSSGLVGQAVGHETLWPGFRSRKFSPQFSFHIDGSEELVASGVQVDFDACYETAHEMIHIEAKTGRTLPSSFNIRQLYFPYRCLREWVPEKQTREFLFFYSQSMDTYHFWEYTFNDANDYESIALMEIKSYRILPPPVPKHLSELDAPLSARSRIPNQADSVRKIEAFPFYVSEGFDDRFALAKVYDFEPRQSDYYGLAAESLGLVELIAGRYHLTETGKKYVWLDDAERQELLCTRMLTVPLIRLVITRLEKDGRVTFDNVIQMVNRELDRQSRRVKGEESKTMGKRRAQTVIAWFRWLGETTGEFVVTRDRNIVVSARD